MAVISFISPKGGSGKTTTAAVVASGLEQAGIDYTIIDADPNKHFFNWGQNAKIKNVVSTNQNDILDDIDKASQETSFVLVDLEGSKNMAMGYAISRSDLVIIPCKMSDLDAVEAMAAISFIRQQEKMLNKKIHYAILRSQTNPAIVTKTETSIINDFKESGCDIFDIRVAEREAYKQIISYGCFVHQLDENTNAELKAKEKALDIVNKLCEQIADKLKGNKSKMMAGV